jgi:hypothetical protein
VGLEHFTYLLDILKKFHGVQYNMAGNKFAGMDIEWNYPAHRCCISMPGYISSLLLKYKHPLPAKLPTVPSHTSHLIWTPWNSSMQTANVAFKKLLQ